MTAIIDNDDVLLADRLDAILPHSSNLDACVGYFNLRGWKSIRSSVHKLDGDFSGESRVRILVGMAMRDADQVKRLYGISSTDAEIDGPTAADRVKEAVKSFVEQLQYGVPSTADQIALRELRDDLHSGLVKVSFVAREPLHAKLYLARTQQGQQWKTAIVGSSNLTAAGLVRQGELNLEETDQEVSAKLHDWFNERWDDQFTVDVTNYIIEAIDNSWAGIQPDPRLIHLKMAFELSRDARAGLTMDIPLQFHNVLLEYQKPAVTIATHLLEKQGLVVIGDVVGLGKTIIGTAIGASTGTRVLVICPKNLVAMWEEHLQAYDVPGKVISLSMVTRELKDLQRYPTVIVDESHNVRNASTQAATAIREYVADNSSNVVLLTATMFNAKHMDLAHQLGLKIGPDEDLGMRPEAFISEYGEEALARKTNGPLSTLRAFEASEENSDWQNLLSKYLIRRTRGYIESNYGTLNTANGKLEFQGPGGMMLSFPKRITKPIEYQGGDKDPGDRLAREENFDAIGNLKLARYSLGRHLLDDAKDDPSDAGLIDDLIKSKNSAQGFIRTTLYKRLASSALAFLSTIERTLMRTHLYIHAVESGLPIPVGELKESQYEIDDSLEFDGELVEDLAEEDRRMDHIFKSWAQNLSDQQWDSRSAELYAAIEKKPGNKVRWASTSWFDADELLIELRHDASILQRLIDEHGEWDPDDDNRLKALAEKVNKSAPGEKLLIFSEYRDTAEYVAQNLKRLCAGRVIEVASGQSSNPTKLARRFSPLSNEKLGGLPDGESEIEVLVATDVLSEGQNLQDCAAVVNWDLPWTIIRIVQRAGRIDRVGQKADEIEIYSFMPHEGVNDLIQLRQRLRRRLRNAGAILGGEDSFFDDDAPGANYRTADRIFDGSELKVDEGDVDYATYALGIWESASEQDQALVLKMPDVCFSTAQTSSVSDDIVLAYSRTYGGYDFVATNSQDGVRAISPLQGLKMSEKVVELAAAEPLEGHHEKVREIVKVQFKRLEDRKAYLHNDGLRARFNQFLNKAAQITTLTIDKKQALNNLIDDFAKYPFLEKAKASVLALVRANKNGESPEVLANQAINLHHDESLLNKLDIKNDDIRIVCSLGLRAGT
jgi:superfamily II DNA or RNA helicase